MNHEISAWESEDYVLTIWGTHNLYRALAVAQGFYRSWSEVPKDLTKSLLEPGNAKLLWADPKVHYFEEAWPDKSFGPTQIHPNWVPFITLSM